MASYISMLLKPIALASALGFIQYCAARHTPSASHNMHDNIQSCLAGHWCADCPIHAAACVDTYTAVQLRGGKEKTTPLSNDNKSLVEATAQGDPRGCTKANAFNSKLTPQANAIALSHCVLCCM